MVDAGQHGHEDRAVAAIGERYRASGRRDRTRIPNEFVAIAGYYRKHARPGTGEPGAAERRANRRYGAAVREALIVDASDRLCSQRLDHGSGDADRPDDEARALLASDDMLDHSARPRLSPVRAGDIDRYRLAY